MARNLANDKEHCLPQSGPGDPLYLPLLASGQDAASPPRALPAGNEKSLNPWNWWDNFFPIIKNNAPNVCQHWLCF